MKKAAALAGDEVALLVYRSNCLEPILDSLTMAVVIHRKSTAPDPLTREPNRSDVGKGSGGDLGTLKKKILQPYI
jgi:hypothetical protein